VTGLSDQTMTTPSIVVLPSTSLLDLDLPAIWQYRELLYFLVWREVKVRYKQTMLGVAWAVLQPLMTMAIFTVIFGMFVNVPSDGLPYPLFALAALLPWTYFSEAMTRSSASLVGDAQLIRKVYFPRLIMPLAAVVSPAVDFLLAFILLLAMMAWYGVSPTWGIIMLPGFLLLGLVTALAVGLWLSALNVRYRDVRHTVPFLIQCWMYASPVAYPVSVVPERWRVLYGLNPMAGVIEGFRWALLGKQSPDVGIMLVSVIAVMALLIGGVVFFKHMEQTFADVI
jgi:homopolymeric O-antigen transport system permease protein